VTLRRNRALRGGIVGFGNVAVEGHLPAWIADRHLQLLAVCDPDPARLAKAEELVPSAHRYATLDEMLEQERLDLVDVATPPVTHVDIVLQLIAKRINVLCEKPLALKPEDCNHIRSAASAAHVVVFTAHNWKSAPIIRTAKRVLRRGDIGTVSRLEIETLRTTPPGSADGATWRLDPALAGGGILVDHGWHAFYLALSMLEAEPVAVSARTAQRKFTDAAVEDSAECTIEFPSAVAEVTLTWAADRRANALRFTADHGTMEVADRTLIVRPDGREPAETAFAQALSAGSYHPDWFTTMLDDLRDELYEPSLRGANFREAEACCRLLELCYRSSAAGGVRLPFREPLPPPIAPATGA
jgi:predicted dehydrogenase